MTTLALVALSTPDRYRARRAVALSNVRMFRAMERRARCDGLPLATSRAANARTSALIVLAHAKQEARRYRSVREILSLGG